MRAYELNGQYITELDEEPWRDCRDCGHRLLSEFDDIESGLCADCVSDLEKEEAP